MTSHLRRAWEAWVALMDRREPATALALARIGLSMVLLLDYLRHAQLGLIDALYAPPPDGYATALHGWPTWFGLTGPAVWLIATCALALIAVGAATRGACIVFVLVSAKLAQIAPTSECGLDQLARIVFVILALSKSHARWSVDAWIARRRGRPMPAEVPAWPRYLLLLQIVWVYASGGMNKSSASWGPLGGFSALADALVDPQAARFGPSWVSSVYPLTQLATLFTMIFELGAPLYLIALYYADTADRPGRVRRLVNRLRLRWIWLALGISFELGIAATLELGVFPFGMIALFPLLLLPRDLQRVQRGTLST